MSHAYDISNLAAARFALQYLHVSTISIWCPESKQERRYDSTSACPTKGTYVPRVPYVVSLRARVDTHSTVHARMYPVDSTVPVTVPGGVLAPPRSFASRDLSQLLSAVYCTQYSVLFQTLLITCVAWAKEGSLLSSIQISK